MTQPVVAILLEVMDKEPGIPALWLWAVGLGALGFAAGRWRRWAALPFVLLITLLSWAMLGELQDPFVGPAMPREAGRSYPWHLTVSAVIGVGLAIAGMVFPKRAS
ncbi:MAG TPA: hypothetical protein VHQ45_10545 [Gemmatimonadaceae bacterium]|nr:hypothetical protein [Gemmatimonadaceae bacterium]